MVAAILLLGAALGITWLHASSDVWLELGLNLTVAWAAFGFLHFRWRNRERRQITPNEAEDIFS